MSKKVLIGLQVIITDELNSSYPKNECIHPDLYDWLSSAIEHDHFNFEELFECVFDNDVRFISAKLVGNFVELTCLTSTEKFDASYIEDEFMGQLSDGWGESVEQYSFGMRIMNGIASPLPGAELWPDITVKDDFRRFEYLYGKGATGRFTFNLSTLDCYCVYL